MDLIAVTDHVPAPDATWRPGDAWLAGGTWLFSEPRPKVSRLLDLTAFGWRPLVASATGLEVAATCTLAELLTWPAPAEWAAWPLVRACGDALRASFKVANAATVGGNLCLGLPAGALISLVTALDGTVTIWSPTGPPRDVPALEFVIGPQLTALAAGELLRAVRLPVAALREPVAFRRAALAEHGRSAAVVIGRRLGADLAVTITAATPRPVRVLVPAGAPAELVHRTVDDAVPGWHDDVHGDPRWRRAMTLRLATEVVTELGGRP